MELAVTSLMGAVTWEAFTVLVYHFEVVCSIFGIHAVD